MVPGHRDKYALVERERRFLLAGPPARDSAAGAGRASITDRYLTGTRLRLRRVTRPGSPVPEGKLTRRCPLPGAGGPRA